jgi:hypothetical protein
MNAIDLLATTLNRRDDQPNQDLADSIIQNKRTDWVEELIVLLHHKDTNIQSDSIKVLYEIGERGAAEMIAPYCKEFGEILTSKNNRLIWGAMTALYTVASVNPEGVFELLPAIMPAIDKGSVITIDHGVGILAKLSAISGYTEITFPLLMEQLRKCPSKQLPMYAEKSLCAVHPENRKEFIDLLLSRLPEMDKESQKTRIKKVIKAVENGK